MYHISSHVHLERWWQTLLPVVGRSDRPWILTTATAGGFFQEAKYVSNDFQLMKQPFPIHHPIETNIYKWMAIFASRYTYIHIKLFKVVEPIHLKKNIRKSNWDHFPKKLG